MTTFIILFILVSLMLFIPAIMSYMKRDDLHHVDRMAGDEGED